ncbi:MAG: biotin transporter BioY [Candidatus Thermoplasmatota archaeon]|jgi:biotin transport system substrate-specific component|nr:biotin transporter BioY [Candidatus Thermoplasmatota archaeon]
MNINIYINKYKIMRYKFFKWRYEISLLYKISLCFFFACLTGVFAQIRFYIPGTPVPVTGQVFGVLLSGVLLGVWGGFSQVIYLGMGLAGLPWFAGFNSGLIYITGPTGGYIIGFIFAAFFIGFIVDRYIKSRNFLNMFSLMLFSTFVLIYTPGLIQLYLWLGGTVNFTYLLSIAVLPFVVADIIKALIATVIACILVPKDAYCKEVDKKLNI